MLKVILRWAGRALDAMDIADGSIWTVRGLGVLAMVLWLPAAWGATAATAAPAPATTAAPAAAGPTPLDKYLDNLKTLRTSFLQTLADGQGGELGAMQAQEDLERFVEAIELVLVEIDGGDAGGDAILRRCVGQGRELGEVRRRFFEHAAADEDLAGERERADVLGLDHRDVLERAESAFGVAALAEDAGLLPEQLRDLGVVVGDVETARDHAEKALALFLVADAAEQLVEGDGTRGVAREALVVGRFGGGLGNRGP